MYAYPGLTPPQPEDNYKFPLGPNGEVPLIPGDIPDEDLKDEVGDL